MVIHTETVLRAFETVTTYYKMNTPLIKMKGIKIIPIKMKGIEIIPIVIFMFFIIFSFFYDYFMFFSFFFHFFAINMIFPIFLNFQLWGFTIYLIIDIGNLGFCGNCSSEGVTFLGGKK